MSTTTYALTVIKPITVTDAMLVSSDVPENDYSAWSGATTYALGDRVILTSTHKIYESLQNSNTGNDPSTAFAWWIEVSPTNRWKVFDTSNSTQTAQSTSIEYVLEPGVPITSFAALNIEGATSLQIQMTDPVYGSVYDRTFDLKTIPTESLWWEWFFGFRSSPTLAVAADLPSFPDAELTINFVGTTDLAVGVILFGQTRKIGLGVELGANVGIQDYSRKETNEFGDTVLAQRAFSKKASFRMMMEKLDVDSVFNYLTSLRAVPCLWIGNESYESTIVFGFYKDFQVTIAYPSHSDCSLEIEGLT